MVFPTARLGVRASEVARGCAGGHVHAGGKRRNQRRRGGKLLMSSPAQARYQS